MPVYLDVVKIYLTILDEPGLTSSEIAKRCGQKFPSFVENKLKKVEEHCGLLYEDEKGGIYAF